MPSGSAQAKLTLEQRAELRQRFLEGESPSRLSAEFRISRSTVYAIAGGADQRTGELRPERSGRLPSKAIADRNAILRERYAAGEAAEVLAAEFGLSAGSIWNICKVVQDTTPQVARLYLTAADAAAELGISRFTMHDYLKAGKFPGAFQIGQRGRFWLVPRAAVQARKEKLHVR